MAEGTTRPDKNAVDKLAADLSEAIVDGNISSQETATLANDLQKVMNSANIPKSEVDSAIAGIASILESSNVSKADVKTIKKDLQNIAVERKTNRGSRVPVRNK